MSDANTNNPRKTEIVIRAFRQGILGHRFSRPLTPAEGNRLSQMIERHGSCLFTDKETGLAMGGWFCTSTDCCETELAIFCAETGVTMTAQAAGDKSFTLTGDDVVEVRVEQIGAADQARCLQTASIASQVATATASEVSTKIACKISEEVAHQTAIQTLVNAGEHALGVAAEPQLIFHQEKPN